MKKLNIILTLLVILLITTNSFGQMFGSSNIYGRSDTLYLINGNVVPTSILNINEDEGVIVFADFDIYQRRFINAETISKDETFYVFYKNEHKKITNVNNPIIVLNIDSLNIIEHRNKIRIGWNFICAGSALLFSNLLYNEYLARQEEPSEFGPKLSKGMNYAGYAAILIGSSINVRSYRIFNREEDVIIDITPVGVRVNF